MHKNIPVVGIIILFILSACAPITFGSNITNSKEQSTDNRYLLKDYYDVYSLVEIPESIRPVISDEEENQDITKAENIVNSEDASELLSGPPMDSPWPMYQHNAANTGYSQATFPNSFNQIWNKSYEEDFNISMISTRTSPVISNGKLYIAGDFLDFEQEKWSSIILTLNQSNGSLIWKKVMPHNAFAFFDFQSFHSPAVYEGKIFTVLGCFFTFMSKSKIVALDENTGDILWEKSFFGTSWYSSVTVADDKVFVCGHMTFCPISWLYAFDVNNGDLI